MFLGRRVVDAGLLSFVGADVDARALGAGLAFEVGGRGLRRRTIVNRLGAGGDVPRGVEHRVRGDVGADRPGRDRHAVDRRDGRVGRGAAAVPFAVESVGARRRRHHEK